MATLAELDFKIILDDSQFNEAVKRIEDTSKQLNENVSSVVDGISKITRGTPGRAVKNAQLESLRSEIISIEKEIDIYQKKMEFLNRNAKLDTDGLLANPATITRMSELYEKTARLSIKLADAKKKFRELGGEKIPTNSLKELQTEANRASVELLQMREYYKRLESDSRRVNIRGQYSGLESDIKKVNGELGKNSKLWRDVSSLAAGYFSIHGATSLVKSLVRVSAEFELQRTTLAAILRDAEKATVLYEQIKQLAVLSPYSFKELATYAKQLSAYSIPVNDLYETTKMLADVSAGLGVGMDRLVLFYGQVRSASFLRGQEVRQATEAGIPILEELRKQFVALGEEGITAGDVFDKISKRLVPFEMVQKVFQDMTSEGGKFFQMQEIQAETLKGKLSNLTDAYQIMFSEIGDKRSGLLKGAVDVIRSLAENYEKVGRVLTNLIVIYGTYRTLTSLVTLAQQAAGIVLSQHIGLWKAMGIQIKENIASLKLWKSLKNFVSANSFALVGAAVVGLTLVMTNSVREANNLKKELEGIANVRLAKAENATREIDALVSKIRDAKNGSQEYRDAIAKLNQKYGEYLPNLITEKNSYNEIADAATKAKNAILEKMRAAAEEEGQQKIEDTYGKTLAKYTLNATNALVRIGIGKEAATVFMKNFRDGLMSGEGGRTTNEISKYFESLFVDFFGHRPKFAETMSTEDYWNQFYKYFDEYATRIRKMQKANSDLQGSLDLAFGDSEMYMMEEEQRRVSQITSAYEIEVRALKKLELTQEEYNKRVDALDHKKLLMLLSLYESLDKKGKPGIFADKVNQIKEQLYGKNSGQTWLQELVNPLVEGNSNVDLKAADGDNLAEYLAKIRGEYKSISSTVKDSDNTYNGLLSAQKQGMTITAAQVTKAKEQCELDAKRKKIIEDIARVLHVSLEESNGGASSGKSPDQISLEERRDTIKDILQWYEKLTEIGIPEDSAKSILASFFPSEKELALAGTFKQALLEIADGLEKFDATAKKSAQSLRNEISGFNLGAIYDAAQAKKKYEQELRKWLAEDFGIEEGPTEKITKIVSEKTTSDNLTGIKESDLKKVVDKQESYIKVQAEQEGKDREQVWNTYRLAAYKAIEDVTKKEREANRITAQEKVNDLAQKIVNDLYQSNLGGNKLSDWTDKSLGQIQSIIDGLKASLIDAGELFDESLSKRAEEAGISLRTLADLVKSIIGMDIENSTVEKVKAATKEARTLISSIQKISSALSSLGDTANNDFVKALADGVDFALEIADVFLESEDSMKDFTRSISDAASSTKNLLKSANVVTLLIKIAATLISKVVDGITAAEKQQMALVDAMREYRNSLDEIARSSYSDIFGADQMGLLAENAKIAAKNLIDFNNAKEEATRGHWLKDLSGDAIYTLNNLSKLYKDVFTEDGDINIEYLRSMRDVWKEQGWGFWSSKNADGSYVTESLIREIDELIAKYDDLQSANEELSNSYSELFSSLSNTIVDNLLANFDEMGDAVYDLGSSFEDLGGTILKSLLNSMILEQVLNKYKLRFANMINDYASAENKETAATKLAKEAGTLAESIKDEMNVLGSAINSTIEAFKENGLYSAGESSGDTLSSGIQGITEDTANLLASYLNAIRADLAGHRLDVKGIATDIKTILGLLPATPTLAEYLAQIQANTYSSAKDTADILSDLRSVITSESGATSVRVQM